MKKDSNRPLLGRVAVVTGASRGIGRAAAIAFAAAGADMAICSRGTGISAVAREVKALGVRVSASRCDISDRAAVRRWLGRVAQRFGRIDILLNNAAILGPRVKLTDYPSADFEKVLRVNVLGALHMMQAVADLSMTRRRSGVIINLSSGAGRHGGPLGGAYAASKFALEGLTQVAAAELKSVGVAVFSLNPGVTRTAMRAAWAPDENPLTIKLPEALGAHLIRLARFGISKTGGCFAVSSAGELLELPAPSSGIGARFKK